MKTMKDKASPTVIIVNGLNLTGIWLVNLFFIIVGLGGGFPRHEFLDLLNPHPHSLISVVN